MPGPSAVLTALAVSGLPVDRFCFEGFLPRKAGERGRRLATWRPSRARWSSSRLRTGRPETLTAMAGAFGADRRAAVCRELTKTYEEVRRGPLPELAAWAAPEVRGEVTLVVAGAPQPAADLAEAAEEVRDLAAGGTKLKAGGGRGRAAAWAWPRTGSTSSS